MRKPLLWFLVLLGLAGCLNAPQAEESKPVSIPVANKQELSQALGKEVVVLGKVSNTGQSSSGHVFLNFAANPQFTVFIEKSVAGQFQKEDPARDFTSKTVTVRGRLEKYRDKIQLKLSSPNHLSLSESQPGEVKEDFPKSVELKPLGKEGWISPAGVRYVGRDPEGLSRKDHVLRHAKDIPDRDGPHGVFDGGEKLAFAWIDEAWQKIRSKHIRPETESGRDTYTVSMGRRVGFLGGKTGAERRHPPLTKIFLVVRQGTSEVITAFPR